MSLTPAVLDALLQAGATAEMIVAAVKADMAERDVADEARRAKDRERKRVPRNSTESTESAEIPETVSPSLSPPDPPNHTPIREKGKTTRTRGGSKFAPADWVPSQALVERAERFGFNSGELERELARFRNHEFPRPYTHWDKTFLNWLDRAAERKNERNHRPERITSIAGLNERDSRSRGLVGLID